MAIRFRCSNCRQKLSIAGRKAGHQVSCPQCGVEITVPLQEQPSPPLIDEQSPTSKENRSQSEQAPKQENSLREENEEQFQEHFSQETQSEESSPLLRKNNSEPETDFDSDDEKDDNDEGFTFNRSGNLLEEMDLTPMVDVTFLLLIFFMITASFSLQKTIEIPEPDPEEQGATQSIQTLDDLLDNSIKVDIDERNVIYVDDERIQDPSSLAETLRARSRTEQKSELVLVADPRALHETVVTVVDAANAAGMQRIRLASTSNGET